MKQTAVFVLALSGCVGPLVDDTVTRTTGVLDSPAEVPDLDPTSALAKQIDAADQVGRTIPRRSAFAAGKRVWYWDFGEATSVALPLYALVRKAPDGAVTPVAEHPYIIDSVPGASGYSPFWTVYYVPVTDRYAGEGIPSVAALQEAQQAGLLGEPEATGLFADCPVVHPDVRLVTRDGELAPARAFYRGVQVPLFPMGNFEEPAEGHALAADVVQVRREGGEPLDEGVRNVDMTGDGDQNDTNTLFETDEAGAIATPLWRLVTAAVPSSTALVDTTQDEKTSDIMDFRTLFGDGGKGSLFGEDDVLVPQPTVVVAFQTTTRFVNCPIEPPAVTP